MASGTTHAKVASTVLLTGAVLGTSLVVLEPASVAVVVPFMLGLFNGYLVTPDIDMQGTTIEEIRWKSFPIIGRVIFFLFASFWYPYSLLFAHRGLSHVPVFGTLTRWIYQSLLLGGFIWLLIRPDLSGAGTYITTSGVIVDLFFYLSGWCIQDFGHLLLDVRPPWRRSKKASSRRVKGAKGNKGHYPTAPSYRVFIEALRGTAF